MPLFYLSLNFSYWKEKLKERFDKNLLVVNIF